MDLEERLDTGHELEPVSEAQVIRYWLREELDEADDDPLDADAVESEPGLREELLERKPIARRMFGAEPADWYYADLTETELRDLHVVVGPHDEDWRALTEDNRVGSIAQRIHEVETGGETSDGTDDEEATTVAELDAETPKDVGEVVEMADAIDPEGPVSRLIVAKEGDDPAYVADGNHRAVAHVLYLLRGGEFAGQEAYVGVQR